MRRIIEMICAIILVVSFFTGVAAVFTLGVIILAAALGVKLPIWLAAGIIAVIAVCFHIVSDDEEEDEEEA